MEKQSQFYEYSGAFENGPPTNAAKVDPEEAKMAEEYKKRFLEKYLKKHSEDYSILHAIEQNDKLFKEAIKPILDPNFSKLPRPQKNRAFHGTLSRVNRVIEDRRKIPIAQTSQISWPIVASILAIPVLAGGAYLTKEIIQGHNASKDLRDKLTSKVAEELKRAYEVATPSTHFTGETKLKKNVGNKYRSFMPETKLIKNVTQDNLGMPKIAVRMPYNTDVLDSDMIEPPQSGRQDYVPIAKVRDRSAIVKKVASIMMNAGAFGDGTMPQTVPAEEVAMGVKVEHEHVRHYPWMSKHTKKLVARGIASDHLKENPKYYSALLKHVEKKPSEVIKPKKDAKKSKPIKKKAEESVKEVIKDIKEKSSEAPQIDKLVNTVATAIHSTGGRSDRVLTALELLKS